MSDNEEVRFAVGKWMDYVRNVWIIARMNSGNEQPGADASTQRTHQEKGIPISNHCVIVFQDCGIGTV
jgi:hypothetical protein